MNELERETGGGIFFSFCDYNLFLKREQGWFWTRTGLSPIKKGCHLIGIRECCGGI